MIPRLIYSQWRMTWRIRMPWRIRVLFFWLIFSTFPFFNLIAQNSFSEQITIEKASNVEYLMLGSIENFDGQGLLLVQGGVKVRFGERTLFAEEVRFSPDSGELYAEGNIAYNEGSHHLRGELFYYNTKKSEGVLYKARSNLGLVTFIGDKILLLPKNTYEIRMGWFSSSKAIIPHYFFRAEKVLLYGDKEVLAYGMTLYVGQTPIFYLPVYFDTYLGTGILSRFGISKSKGVFVQNSWFWGLNDPWLFLPDSGIIKFDYYQFMGPYVGFTFDKKRGPLIYNIEMDIANYKFREKVNVKGEPKFTTFIKQTDGTRKEITELWWKIDADMEAVFKEKKTDTSKKILLKFESYKNRNFDIEFGSRPLPKSTLDLLAINPILQGKNAKDSLDWEAVYTDQRGLQTLQMKVQRRLIWYYSKKKYLPINETTPELYFLRSWQIISPKNNFGGVWLKTFFKGGARKLYNKGEINKTLYDLSTEASITSPINLTSFWYWEPLLGYGLFEQSSKEETKVLKSETDQNSYQYLYTKNLWRFGIPLASLSLEHYYRLGIQEAQSDLIFGSTRKHFTTFTLASDYEPFGKMSLKTSRDLRKYPDKIPEKERWSDFIFSASFNWDFAYPKNFISYGLDLKRRGKNYSEIEIQNIYRHSLRFNQPYLNKASIRYKIGGYKIKFLGDIFDTSAGISWNHNFVDLRQSLFTFEWQIGISPWRKWRFYTGARSIVEEMEDFSYTKNKFWKKLGASFDPFFTNEPDTLINLEKFYIDIEHDLAEWILSFSFSNARRTVFYGKELKNTITYYEKSIYFSFGMRGVNFLSLPKVRLYRSQSPNL